jgi:HCOMODA/2-hydroxy-3-carboxy-muconic semialdehyde decarboxylase
LAALTGPELPVWDIRDNFGDTNLLVTTMDQGRDLADCLGDRRVSLMRGHGCVIAGKSIREVVMASVYLQVNAGMLLEALRLGDVKYLSPGEIKAMTESQMSLTGQERAWEYWANRAGRGKKA